MDSIYFQVQDKNTSGTNIFFIPMASTINHKIFPLAKWEGRILAAYTLLENIQCLDGHNLLIEKEFLAVNKSKYSY